MLKLTNLHKTFNAGTVNEKKALNGLDFQLDSGDFATIVGSNGAGKSTMFNAITGAFFVEDGTIELDGEDITFVKEHRRSKYIGHLFQDPMKGTAPHMTIEENLAIAYLRASTPHHAFFSRVNKKDKELFREHLSLLGMDLENRMRQPVGLLSGGQRQALTLLMSSLKKPKLLLLDEHTAALDPATASKVLEISDKIVEENDLTTMMITHNMKDAIRHGNRLIMMNQGKIILDIRGEEKQHLSKHELIEMFAQIASSPLESDEVLLSR